MKIYDILANLWLLHKKYCGILKAAGPGHNLNYHWTSMGLTPMDSNVSCWHSNWRSVVQLQRKTLSWVLMHIEQVGLLLSLINYWKREKIFLASHIMTKFSKHPEFTNWQRPADFLKSTLLRLCSYDTYLIRPAQSAGIYDQLIKMSNGFDAFSCTICCA